MLEPKVVSVMKDKSPNGGH